MKEVKFVIRFLGIPIKIVRTIPATMGDLTEIQFLTLIQFFNGAVKERIFIKEMFQLSFILSSLVSFRKYWIFKLIESIETLCDLKQSVDRFLINRLPGTDLVCFSKRFKGVSFMQFMFIDTMYTQYLRLQNEHHLYSFIAALYMKEGESYKDFDVDIRTIYLRKKKINPAVYEAVMLNYMMLKKWLTAAYPFMFSSGDENGSSHPQKQQKWLDIFDAFVGEQIPDTEYYKNMPCMDAFRIINRRMKDFIHGKQ